MVVKELLIKFSTYWKYACLKQTYMVHLLKIKTL
jgi:hypothetical protein